MKTKAWPLAMILALGLMTSAHAADPVGYVAADGVNTVPVTTATPLPVAPVYGTSGASSTDASGTVASGGVYQTVFAASSGRKGCLIQNPITASEALNVKVGTMSSPFAVPVGGTFSCASFGGPVVTDAITVTAATTAHAFTAVSQ